MLARALAVFSVVSWALLIAFPAVGAGVIEVGGQRELFVDRTLIERMDGTELRMALPCAREAVIAFDRPWEGRYCGYVTVLDDDGLFRMYYRGLPVSKRDGSDAEVTCYAESQDGRRFTKPDLGLFEVEGGRDNNVILAGMAPFSHNFAPFIDTKPGVPAEEKYKALAGTKKSGLVSFVSADGIRWRKLWDEPVIKDGAFDSQNVAFWAEREQCYAAYFRTWTEGDWGGCRWVSRSTSTDFKEWTEPVEMGNGGAPWEHIYTNQTVPYPRAPHLYLAIAARFMPGRRVVSVEEAAAMGVEGTYSGDCSDVVLMTSRGGNAYDRSFMGAFVKPGTGLANWTSRTNYPARGVVQTAPGELSIYVQKNYGQPSGHLQRYSLRTDGFASVSAPYEGGTLVTKPLRFDGQALYLNFATSAAGSVRVEVQGEGGQAIEGYAESDSAELIGDFIERVVRWKGNSDLSPLAGKPVRLRFVMKDADLYAFRFGRE